MAEINFNNLYNQLNPMDKMFYDQQFQKSYDPNKENLKLSGQENYDQMKAVYDAQQQVPEKSVLDKITNLFGFGSASAAEMPQVPNLTYRNIDLPFNLNTGVTNTTAASPFLKSMADIDASGNVNTDLVNQLIEENQKKTNPFDPRNFQSIFPTNVQTGIRQQVPLQNLGIDTSYGVANEPDEEQVEYLTEQEPSGITKLLSYLPFGENSILGNVIRSLPQESPEIRGMKNFYGNRYGLTDTGQVASGIMKGYNPVSGGFLNFITGGKFGKPTSYGLADAMQRRIENILSRKAAQTDASRAKVAELRNLQRQEIQNRADRGESLSSIGKSTFTGKGQAFEKKSGGSSGVKGTSSERNYGGR
jgi:hypothetical protein